MPILSGVTTVALLGAFAWIAVCDVRSLTISNRTLMVTYALSAAWFLAHPAAFDLSCVAMAGVFFLIGFALWMAGVFGGGDAKALPLCALFAGSAFVPAMLAVMAFVSLALALGMVSIRVVNARVPLGGALVRCAERRAAPFGVPIAAAAGVTMLMRAGIA